MTCRVPLEHADVQGSLLSHAHGGGSRDSVRYDTLQAREEAEAEAARAAQAAAHVAPEVKYAQQLAALQDMGFPGPSCVAERCWSCSALLV